MTALTRATGFDRVFVYVMLSGMVLDRASKLIADAVLKGQASIPVIDGYVDLHYARNTGAMFGALDHWPAVLRMIATRIVPALLAVTLAVTYLRTPTQLGSLRMSLVFMLTGTVANLVDRFKHEGVIDFINLRIGEQSAWLTINLADLYIAVGVALLAWHLSVAPSSNASETP